MASRAPQDPFRYFKTSPEIIRLAVMLYVKYPLSLKERGKPAGRARNRHCLGTIRYWWNRFGPMFTADIRRQRVSLMRGCRQWR